MGMENVPRKYPHIPYMTLVCYDWEPEFGTGHKAAHVHVAPPGADPGGGGVERSEPPSPPQPQDATNI
jgi:hypothetical protein